MYAATKLGRPADLYRPHAGQLAFHTAPHRIRALFPGNRWGKTTALGIEVNSYCRPDQCFGPRPTDQPAQVLWFCTEYRQYELLRPRLERDCFDAGWVYNQQDNFYQWPNKARLWIIPGTRDWRFIQGTNPDLVVIDEECPPSLYSELGARGIGDRDTRYLIGATATGGSETWMRERVYEPWKKHHLELGLDEDAAIATQAHPDIFCLPRGSLSENPSMTPEKVALFRGLHWMGGQKEWAVRNFGGFESWSSDPVFAAEDLEWLKERRKGMPGGVDGMLGVRAV